MQKKTILYLVTQSEMGGAQKYVLDLIRAMQTDYRVVVGLGEQGNKGWLAERLRDEKTEFHFLPSLKRSIKPYRDFMAVREISQLISQVKPDILHLNSSKASVLGAFAARKLHQRNKLKVIYTAHGWVFAEPLSSRKRKLYYHAEKYTAKLKDRIICISEFDRDIAIKQSVAKEKQIALIPNGLKKVDFLPRLEAREYIWQMIDPEGALSAEERKEQTLIGSIGNLYPAKGYGYLLNAAKMLVDYGLNIKLAIIGEGKERGELEDWISQLRLDNNVFLLGQLEQASRYLKAFDIYVCSSVKEGLSYTVIEAMQAGLPIVATRVGGNPDLIQNGEEGILIEPASAEELATGVIKILNNDQRGKMGKQACQKALEQYSLDRMIDQTKKLSEVLLSE
jgi:glycosyltransferase involved in cell wall biosynthesis